MTHLGLLAVLLAGCGSDPSGPASPRPLFPRELLDQSPSWEDCLIDEDVGRGSAQCAVLSVPVRWAEPDGATIPLRVKRRLAQAPADKQLWLNAGGPGWASTMEFGTISEDDPLTAMEAWSSYLGADVYAFDHRGTGGSARLGCPDQESESSPLGFSVAPAEWPACVEAITQQDPPSEAFNVTEAATDQAFVAELFREPSKRRFVLGISYGTYLAHRYAQLYPTQADGIIFDSVCPSVGWHLDGYDEAADVTIRKVFDLCAADAFCSGKVGNDPYQAALAALQGVRDRTCAVGLSEPDLQGLAFRLASEWSGRPAMVALFYRLARCNAGDVAAIQRLADPGTTASGPAPSQRAHSDGLFLNIGLSELMSGAPLDANREVTESRAIPVASWTDYWVVQRGTAATWPTYALDEHVRGWAPPEAPLLMLQGDLDPKTPIEIASAARDHLTGPAQHWVTIPGGDHILVVNSPVAGGGESCALRIIRSYVDDPRIEPDTGCTADLLPVTFEGDPAWALARMGTSDLWEGTP